MTGLTSILDEHLDSWQLTAPTYAAAVFDPNGVIAFGSRRYDDRFSAPERSDVFRICSMSKSFLAASLLVLSDRGLLDLDAPLAQYIPEFHDPGTGTVTVRMLLSNSSGMPEDNAWIDHHLALSREEFDAMAGQGFRFTEIPGRSYQYSNMGFSFAGQVVERITGRAYEEFLRSEILVPLGLDDTRYRADEYGPAHHLARGRSTFDDGANWVDREFVGSGVPAAAGALFSTVDDIASWCGWLSAALRPHGGPELHGELLPAALRAEMQRIHTPIHSMQARVVSPRNDAIGYGLGLMVEEDTRFGTIAQHSGGLPGFSTNMRWHTDSGLGVVVYATTEGQQMASRAADLLDAVLRQEDVPARRIALWPETFSAAERIDEALRSSGDYGRIATLLSDNVFYEVPAETRRARFAELTASIGGLVDEQEPLTDRLLWCVSAAQLVWKLQGASGAVQVRIELANVPGTPVQRLEVEPLGAELAHVIEGADLVVRHYLPVVT